MDGTRDEASARTQVYFVETEYRDDVIPTSNRTFQLGIVLDHCAVKTCTNDIILTADW